MNSLDSRMIRNTTTLYKASVPTRSWREEMKVSKDHSKYWNLSGKMLSKFKLMSNNLDRIGIAMLRVNLIRGSAQAVR